MQPGAKDGQIPSSPRERGGKHGNLQEGEGRGDPVGGAYALLSRAAAEIVLACFECWLVAVMRDAGGWCEEGGGGSDGERGGGGWLRRC